METKKATGRPTVFSEEIAEKIAELIRDGYSERQIEKMEGMPSRGTMTRWKHSNAAFCRLTVEARQASAELYDEKRLEVVERLKDRALASLESGEDMPRSAVDALKVVIQEYARQASIRDDARYSDRVRPVEEQVLIPKKLEAAEKQIEDGKRLNEMLSL